MERDDQEYSLDSKLSFTALNLSATGVELIPDAENVGGFPVTVYVDESTQPLTVDARGVIRQATPFSKLRVDCSPGGAAQTDRWRVKAAPGLNDAMERRPRQSDHGELYTRVAPGRVLRLADSFVDNFAFGAMTSNPDPGPVRFYLDPDTTEGFWRGEQQRGGFNMGPYQGATLSLFSNENTGPTGATMLGLFVEFVDTGRNGYYVTVLRTYRAGSINNLVGAPPRTVLSIDLGRNAGGEWTSAYGLGTPSWSAFMRFGLELKGSLAEYSPSGALKHLRLSLTAS